MGRTESRMSRTRDGRPFEVRTATEGDIDAIIAHERHMLEHNPFKVREPEEVNFDSEEYREHIREYLEGDGKLSLIAVARGEVVGRLTFRNGKLRKMSHHGYFGIAVNDGWRGQGVGRAMIGVLLDWAAAGPLIEKVYLGVFAGNDSAIELYRKMGFVEESRVRQYFKIGPGRYSDDVQMSIWVKPGLAPDGFGTWAGRKG